jgi:uncharacterized membrane protein
MLGYASVMDIQLIITKKFNRGAGWIVALSSLVLGSFGIYLGRYLRWNTWDVLASPVSLFLDIAKQLIDPLSHLRTFGITIIYSLFLVLGYLLLLQIITTFKASEK